VVDGLAFAASVVQSLAWPVSAVVIVVVLRRPIAAVLQRLTKAKVGPVEAEFDQELAEVRSELQRSPEAVGNGVDASSAEVVSVPDELSRLVEVSPRAAVLEAFARIETRLSELLTQGGVDVKGARSGVALARLAHQHKLITDQSLNAVEGLAVMRNLAAHGPAEAITVERARDYLVLVDTMFYPLRTPPRR